MGASASLFPLSHSSSTRSDETDSLQKGGESSNKVDCGLHSPDDSFASTAKKSLLFNEKYINYSKFFMQNDLDGKIFIQFILQEKWRSRLNQDLKQKILKQVSTRRWNQENLTESGRKIASDEVFMDSNLYEPKVYKFFPSCQLQSLLLLCCMSCYFDIRHQIEFEANRFNKQVALSVDSIRTKMFIRQESSEFTDDHDAIDAGSSDTHNMYTLNPSTKHQIAVSTVLRSTSGSKYEALDRLYRIPDERWPDNEYSDEDEEEDEKNPEVFLSELIEHGLAKEDELESLLSSGTWMAHVLRLLVEGKAFVTVWDITPGQPQPTPETIPETIPCPVIVQPCPVIVQPCPVIVQQCLRHSHSGSVSFATTSLHHPFSACSSIDEELEEWLQLPIDTATTPTPIPTTSTGTSTGIGTGMLIPTLVYASPTHQSLAAVEEHQETLRIAEHRKKLLGDLSCQQALQSHLLYKTSYYTASLQCAQLAILPLHPLHPPYTTSNTSSKGGSGRGGGGELVVVIEHPILATTQFDGMVTNTNTGITSNTHTGININTHTGINTGTTTTTITTTSMSTAQYDRMMVHMMDMLLFMVGLLVLPSSPTVTIT